MSGQTSEHAIDKTQEVTASEDLETDKPIADVEEDADEAIADDVPAAGGASKKKKKKKKGKNGNQANIASVAAPPAPSVEQEEQKEDVLVEEQKQIDLTVEEEEVVIIEEHAVVVAAVEEEEEVVVEKEEIVIIKEEEKEKEGAPIPPPTTAISSNTTTPIKESPKPKTLASSTTTISSDASPKSTSAKPNTPPPASAISPAANKTYLADTAKAWGGVVGAAGGTPTHSSPSASVLPGQEVFSYADLKELRAESGIDMTRKESYLSDDEFIKVFGKDRAAYSAQPAWRQQLQKKEAGLW